MLFHILLSQKDDVMKKVLFIITSPESGGTETYLLRFLNFSSSINNCTVLCKKSIDGNLASKFEKLCKLDYIGRLGYVNPLPYIKLLFFLKKNKFDSVCDFTGNFSALDIFCSKLMKVPVRISFYRESRNQFKPTLFKRFYAHIAAKMAYKFSTKILSNSEEALNYFYPGWRNNDINKCLVIYNGFDMRLLSKKTKHEIRSQLNIPLSSFVICHTGRYTAAKNHEMIIKCAEKICSKYEDIIFLLVGSNVNEVYNEEIKRNNLGKQIRLLGYRSDVLDILKCADLFYFPSLNEGQPNALIEAMASGLPFIASNIPTIRETVPPSCVNSLIDPTNLIENIDAIEKAYKDKYSLIGYAKWAQNKFSSNILFKQFLTELA